MTIVEQHRAEIDQGQRFAFGKNWADFLSRLNEDRIALAQKSLSAFLEVERLDGKTFLDIGSGSGLFSLAARRLGARVFSFDYDTDSVGCTQELRRRFFPNDENWRVEQGSVLDTAYLAKLGTFDIVYSWGVLHHTGRMWDALDNVKPLVPIGGKLYIAIYNDQGSITDRWAEVKRHYNSLPKPLALLYALSIVAKEERAHLASHRRNGTTSDWLRTWREYDKISTRGMSRWHDWIDWIGGYPYERATIERIVDRYAFDGFRLTKLFDCSDGYGCNEFVFHRESPAGTYVNTPMPGGNSFARRFGVRIPGPLKASGDRLVGHLSALPQRADRQDYFFLSNDQLVDGTARHPDSCELPRRVESIVSAESAANYVVAAESVVMNPPFVRRRGHMWEFHVPHLSELADHSGGGERSSPVFVFENGRQLPLPHAAHDNIDAHGCGRFSHWGASVYFSTTDNSDPNTNGRIYQLLIARKPT
ncbi:class I SAM-dependent methyltransferase [Bradyrhizobium sp. LHD-71]|uniref:class I SAM-dependent methyltransferase n=1 Tax=Bradyrhizobium sp. LHD-71 TaxID=3072141 RepID=UPI00280CDD36|nr:class I SAM-dependent methyltransferase [Bradyrhizobium sp. LHD-71]MDQ8728353.1 class I SAM-dependent methyltransferase [Bradyrhizobium sp. LHD-71]